MMQGTAEIQMNMELPPGSNADDIMDKIIVGDLVVDVKYLRSLPKIFEPQASFWTHT